MLEKYLGVVFSVCLLTGQVAHGASLTIVGQALPLNASLPNQDSYQLTSDGIASTSLRYDTGLLFDGATRSARSAASVNLKQGTLRIYTEINNGSTANARATMSDGVVFDLPDGVDSAMVTLNFTVEGSFSGTFLGCADCLSGRLSFGNPIAPNSAPDQQVVSETRNFEVTGLPTTFSITREVVEGPTFFFDAFLRSSSNLNGSSLSMLADLSNTGVLSFELPEEVTYTSESGAFLTAVPVPAAVWMLLSAILSLACAKRCSHRRPC